MLNTTSRFNSPKKNKYTIDRPMTYKEMREQERLNEVANLAPGAYYDNKPFGSDIKQKINFGSKYKFVPKEGPPPGLYNPDAADSQTKPKIREVLIEPEQPRIYSLNDSVLPEHNNFSQKKTNPPPKKIYRVQQDKNNSKKYSGKNDYDVNDVQGLDDDDDDDSD